MNLDPVVKFEISGIDMHCLVIVFKFIIIDYRLLYIEL